MKKHGKLIGEFVLIVVGVLVALMVETALDEREDEKLGEEYFLRVTTDVKADKQALEQRIKFFTSVKQFSQETLDWLASDTPVDQNTLLATFYAAEVWPFVPNLSTYQDLQSTGNIRLINDIDFRTSLAAYFNKADSSGPGLNPPQVYRRIIRGIIPTRIQTAIRQNCPTTDEFDLEPTGFPPCTLNEVDYIELTALYEPLRNDLDFRQTLTYRNSELSVIIYLLRQQVEYADKVLSWTAVR